MPALLRSVGRTLGNAVFILAVTMLGWVVFLEVMDVSPYVGKGPSDVWGFLVTDEDAGTNRAEVFTLLRETLGDAATGFVAGLAAAVVLAAAIVLSPAVESTVMPVAMLLRSVPLIALAPVIILMAGRGELTVAIMGGIVVLFPALVSLVFGLRSASPQMRDVVHVYGGSDWHVLRKVAFPSALPAFFASVRISVPGAVTGALIAEWLATGEGIGYGVVSAIGRAQNTLVWALVVVVTVTSLLLYTLAQLLETFVLARYGKEGGRT